VLVSTLFIGKIVKQTTKQNVTTKNPEENTQKSLEFDIVSRSKNFLAFQKITVPSKRLEAL
jgi:hypothetical protein